MTVETFDAVVERLGHRGDGIAPGPVYVPRALPGERVRGVLVGDRLTELRIIEPAATRVRPPCAHYKNCGGCALQHAADDFVAEWKADVVRSALAAQGIAARIDRVETSPAQSRRRAVFSGRRTKKGALVGLHARASDEVVTIPGCRLMRPEIMAALPVLEALTLAGGSRKGELSLAVALADGGLDVAVQGGKPLDDMLRARLPEIARQGGLARLSWNDEPVAMAHPPAQLFGRARVVPPPGAFLQATREGEAALLSVVRAGVAGARRVVDLFAGCGTFALPLAENAEVHAVEGVAAMLDALYAGWRQAPGLKAVTVETRDLFRRPLRPEELARFDAVVIDPPRAGAAAQVEQIAHSRIGRVAFVSCDPTSFARDARHLTDAGFAIGPVTVVDQFRWSPHVELATVFTRP